MSLLKIWLKGMPRFCKACIGASIPEQSVPTVSVCILDFWFGESLDCGGWVGVLANWDGSSSGGSFSDGSHVSD